MKMEGTGHTIRGLGQTVWFVSLSAIGDGTVRVMVVADMSTPWNAEARVSLSPNRPTFLAFSGSLIAFLI